MCSYVDAKNSAGHLQDGAVRPETYIQLGVALFVNKISFWQYTHTKAYCIFHLPAKFLSCKANVQSPSSSCVQRNQSVELVMSLHSLRPGDIKDLIAYLRNRGLLPRSMWNVSVQ